MSPWDVAVSFGWNSLHHIGVDNDLPALPAEARLHADARPRAALGRGEPARAADEVKEGHALVAGAEDEAAAAVT